MKILYISFAILLIALKTFSQTTYKGNNIYFEAGGNGLFSSLNYERQLTNKPMLNFRLGLGFYSENAFYLSIPIGINYLFELNDKNTFLDAGIGVTWTRINGRLFQKNSLFYSKN